MKKLLLSLLLIPFLLGCKSNSKKSDAPTDQYINVSVNEVSIMEEETYQIETEIIKKGTIVFYSSADDAIASVSDTGLITGIKAGETSITVRGGKDSYVVFVEVTPYQAHDSLQIVLTKESFTLEVGDEYALPLTVKMGNEIIDYPTLSYAFSDNTIVSIEGTMVTALKAGTTSCVVTASYQEQEVSKGFTISVY